MISPHEEHVLFICSCNWWRSTNAEPVWPKHLLLSVRCAGSCPNARRKAEFFRLMGGVRHASLLGLDYVFRFPSGTSLLPDLFYDFIVATTAE